MRSRKCTARKKDGTKCTADAQTGKSVCVFHDPSRRADGRRARKAGGINRSRPRTALSPMTPEVPLSTMGDVGRLLAETINQVRCGRLDSKIASTVGYLGSILLKALEQGSIEERLSQLEAITGAAPPVDQSRFDFVEGGNKQ